MAQRRNEKKGQYESYTPKSVSFGFDDPSMLPKAPAAGSTTVNPIKSVITQTKAPVTPKFTGLDVAKTTEQATKGFIPQQSTPIVPTAKNPVVDESPVKPNISNVDYTAVDNLDTQGLYRFIDNIQVRASSGEQISSQDQLLMREAQRKIQQSLNPTTVANPYDTQIASEEQAKAVRAAELKAREEAIFTEEEKRLNALYARRTQEAVESGARTAQASAKATSFSGFGRSTFNADQQTKIQQDTENIKYYLDQEKLVALEKYKAELAGATGKELEGYNTTINSLREKSATFLADQAKTINEFNQKSAATYEDKINNLLAYASNWTDPKAPLTEDELAQAKAFGSLLIDKDGKVNEKFAEQIPAKLYGEALKSAAEARGAIPTNDFGFINVGGGLVAITDPTTGEVRYEQGQVPKEYSLEKIGDTGYVFDPTTGSTVQAGTTIDRETATSKYGSTPAVRNFNPGNIMDTGFGGQKVAGERFTRFDTPQQGFNALVAKIQNIQAGNSQVYSPDMTLTQYMGKYAPASDNNNPQAYANSVAKFLGVPVGTTIGQIDPVKLAEAHAKHEDGNSYQMLKDLGIFGGAKGETSGLSGVAQMVQNGTLKLSDVPAEQRMSVANELASAPESQAGKEKSQELVNRIDRIKTALNNKLLPRGSALLDPDIAADVDYIKNNLMLKTFAEAKASGVTFGAASNAEWEALKNAATSIKRTMSKDALTTELDRLKTAAGGVGSTPETTTTGGRGKPR